METITNKSNVNFTNYYSGKTKTQRIATGVASFALPGLGQVINGENTKGIAYLLGSLLNVATFLARYRKNIFVHRLIALVIRATAAIDAYKKS